ncbi:MAG: ATP-NAD kinase family protein [Christensenellaceae bacterium]|jgi:predicted polyphosphate/ATP-dependent NAD kinase|nr:ATP-NAD kinase family protein [Christensenellaceae bacterium]
MKRIGILINPIAGLGGSVALKGSDGADILQKARALGALPQSAQRARATLAQLAPYRSEVAFLTYGGAMGEQLLTELGFAPIVVGTPHTPTRAADTKNAARALRDAGAELLLFAGGDGTARDICEAVGQSILVLGIPAGVKMHSSVYALNPLSAGLAAAEYIQGKAAGRRSAEVMDIDEAQFRNGQVRARLYGSMDIPALSGHMQSAKSPNAPEEDEMLGMAGYIVNGMRPGELYFLGPGSTTFAIKADLGIAGTLLGIDVVRDGAPVLFDATEPQLWALLQEAKASAHIVVTLIGGQGLLFGRGNQQFSPRVLRHVGRSSIQVVATRGKLRALEGRPMMVDTGDSELDAALCGYMDIVVDYEQTVFYKVADR